MKKPNQTNGFEWIHWFSDMFLILREYPWKGCENNAEFYSSANGNNNGQLQKMARKFASQYMKMLNQGTKPVSIILTLQITEFMAKHHKYFVQTVRWI